MLDWLVFRDPSARAVAHAIEAGEVRWLVTPEMRAELLHVLPRPALQAWKPDAGAIEAHWQRWSTPVTAWPGAAGPLLRCRDPDDQKFIDLAVQVGARSLLSRDRAVLRLAAPARALGIAVMPAARWQRA